MKLRRIRAGHSALTRVARVACRIVVDGKRPLARLGRRCEGNIKMDHKHLGCEYVDRVAACCERCSKYVDQLSDCQILKNAVPLRSFIHQWLYSPLFGPDLFFSFVIFLTQTVGLLGRVISPSQSRYLHTGQHKQNKRSHRHPCLEWDSNWRSQRSSERRQFMP
jgi:hypothetical protein